MNTIVLRGYNVQNKELKIIHQTNSGYKTGQIISLESYIRLLRSETKVMLLDFEQFMHELMTFKLKAYYEQLQEENRIAC
jgi:protein-tyrosine phosphatase